MNPSTEGPELTKELTNIYQSEKAAQVIFDLFKTRAKRSAVTNVKQLEALRDANDRPLRRSQIIAILKKLERLNLGAFKSGRRGHESRFEWTQGVHLGEVGRKAVVDQEADVEQPPHEESVAQLVQHSYPLRPTLFVRFDLPADLTQWEATRLANHIKTLTFDRPEGGIRDAS